MRKRAWVIAAVLAAVCAAAPAATVAQSADESPAAAFRRLRGEGVAAANTGDMATAANRLAQADALVPNHPGLTVLRARLAAASDRMPEAVALMDRYAGFGFTIDVTADETLQRISIEDGFAPVLRQLTANAAPVGKLEIVGQIEGAYLAEAVAFDERRDRFLISGVHGRTILAVKREKSLSRYLAASPEIDSVMGLMTDPAGGVLWASVSARPQASGLPADHKGRGGLLKIDLASGRVLARYDAPPAQDRAMGDLTLAADGAVFVSDSMTGEIWRLRPGAEALDLVVPAGVLASPQSMVATGDGRLIVADYTSGLQSVNLATGQVWPVPVPANASLIGTDGLIRDGADLIAFQNGTNPQRIVRLSMDPAMTRVERWTVLAANLPNLEEPTSGVVVGDDLVFVARSQWTDFAEDGSLRRNPPGPAVIARLKLR